MKLKLFEFAVLLHEYNDAKETIHSSIVINLTPKLAVDENAVKIYAARQIPSELENQLNNVEILVRQF